MLMIYSKMQYIFILTNKKVRILLLIISIDGLNKLIFFVKDKEYI